MWVKSISQLWNIHSSVNTRAGHRLVCTDGKKVDCTRFLQLLTVNLGKYNLNFVFFYLIILDLFATKAAVLQSQSRFYWNTFIHKATVALDLFPLWPFIISLESRVLYSIILLYWAVPKTTARYLDFTIVLKRAGVLTLYVCWVGTELPKALSRPFSCAEPLDPVSQLFFSIEREKNKLLLKLSSF